MMSIRAVHAGEGYRYLLRSVATNDADPEVQNTAQTTAGVEGNSPTGQIESGDRLSAYYQAKGTPPGRWCGRGVAGLASETVTAGAQVTEDQMAALYGEGLHPDADARIGSGESVKDVQLGRKFSIYTGGHPVLVDLAAAEKTFRVDHPPGCQRLRSDVLTGEIGVGAVGISGRENVEHHRCCAP